MKHTPVFRSLSFLFLTLVAASSTMTAQTVTALPIALTFNYQAGNALPAAQTVAVKISAGTPTYTVAISGINTLWLTVTPDAGKLPATLSARVNPTSLSVGQYLEPVPYYAGSAQSGGFAAILANISTSFCLNNGN